MKDPVIHKQGKQYAQRYTVFGYEKVPSPLCVGSKMLWKGYSYFVHRNWKYVTCKHCLRKKSNETTKSK